tara:strand:+ start:384 stop:656 length:273 start_codon:yes stop_codon:yes gene_type:complete
MTDSSSKDREEIANMAGELIQAKMDSAKKDTQMTHMMRIGTFHMEIVPDASINIEELFNNMLDKLMKKYGDKILTMNINQIADGSNRHYG